MVGEEEWCSWGALRVSEVSHPRGVKLLTCQVSLMLYFLLILLFFLILLPVHHRTPWDANFHSPFPPHSFAMSGMCIPLPLDRMPASVAATVTTSCSELGCINFVLTLQAQSIMQSIDADLLISHTKIMKVFFSFKFRGLNWSLRFPENLAE